MRLTRILALALAMTTAWAETPSSTTHLTTINTANQARYTEGHPHAMIRRLVGVAACGLSMWDMAQSAKYTGRGGIVEANGLLAGTNGRANIGTMAGVKIGMCAAPIILGELGAHWHSSALTNLGLVGSAGSAAVSGAVVLHNQSVIARQGKLMPGTPAGK